MKFGLNVDSFHGEQFNTLIPLLMDLGIKYIELWAPNLAQKGPVVSEFAFSDKDLKTAKDQLDKAGIQVACIGCGIGLDEEFTKDAGAYSDEFVKTVEAAAFFGAKYVNHYSTKIQIADRPDVEALKKYWAAGLKRAEELGVILCLENEATDITWSPENVLEVVRGFNSKNFKTNFDSTNYYHSGHEAYPWAYELLKDEIAYVHIKGGRKYVPEFCQDEKFIGTPMTRLFDGDTIYYCQSKYGAVNIEGELSALKKDGYNGFCVLEPHTDRNNTIIIIHKEINYLRSTGLFEE